MGGKNNIMNVREKSSAEVKVEWLLKNQPLWAYDYKERSINKEKLVGDMKRDGLVAATTYWKDVKLSRVFDIAFERMLNGQEGREDYGL